jgi:hypothetical protein
MVDLMSWLYVSILFLSLYASIKEREFLPLLIGSVCGVIRMIVGYAVPAAAQFFSSTGINGLIVIGVITVILEVVMRRDKNKILFYFTYYLGVSFTSFLGESYGMLSGFWENVDKELFGLPWRRILITNFLAFFVILKFGELIYFFVFKKTI